VPFIVHPIEVGRLLRGDGQPDHVVAAGLLHDVLEKTATPALELEREFGTRVAQLVAAVSDDPSIKVYEERKRELRDRVERSGSETLAVYAADKIAKVRELGLLSAWRACQRKNQAKLGHWGASSRGLWQEDATPTTAGLPSPRGPTGGKAPAMGERRSPCPCGAGRFERARDGSRGGRGSTSGPEIAGLLRSPGRAGARSCRAGDGADDSGRRVVEECRAWTSTFSRLVHLESATGGARALLLTDR
jgi:HD domain